MDIVEKLCNETEQLDAYLLEKNEVSLRIVADSNLRKSILLASASFFEKEIVSLIVTFTRHISNDDRIISFVQKKGLSRQYHTLFQWDGNNINSFLGLFGESFKTGFLEKIQSDEKLDKGVKDFLEIGRERNRMVHQDFGSFTLEKTSAEIHQLHISAKIFLEKLTQFMIGDNKKTAFGQN